MTTQQLYIDGHWTDGNDHYTVTNPWDHTTLAEVVAATPGQVTAAIDAAAAALLVDFPAHERGTVLVKTARLVAERADQFAGTISNEAGKPITAARTEVARAVDTLQLSAEAARTNAGRQVPLDAVAAGVGLIGFEIPQPRGIVAAITPFNFPLNLVAHKLGPAVAAGCPVVLKPSEKTPMTAALLVQAFHDAGLPAGRLNLVTGQPADVVTGMLEDPRVTVVTFTGSAELGWAIKAKSPTKHHILELGSNTAMVVAGDAELDRAVAAAVTSSFTFAGQAYISLQRIYVHHTVEEEFLARFTKATADLPAGDPASEDTVIGPLITTDARDRVAGWVSDAVDTGPTLHTGGQVIDGVLPATILSNVPKTAALICQEAFGPVVSVNTYDSLDDAIAQVNDSRFGLNTSLYTSNITAALEYAAHAEAGTVLINTPPFSAPTTCPTAGSKTPAKVAKASPTRYGNSPRPSSSSWPADHTLPRPVDSRRASCQPRSPS